MHTDASGYGIGAVLAQMQLARHSGTFDNVNKSEVVIAYCSKHLSDRQSQWSTTEKEAYAIIHAVDVFRPYLYGRTFTVYTDHRPLEWLMSKKEPSGRLARWALKLQEYDIIIAYRPGKNNQNADCLSRLPVNSVDYVFKDQTLAKDCENESNYNTITLASEKEKNRCTGKYSKKD